jgi:hypothetical protein
MKTPLPLVTSLLFSAVLLAQSPAPSPAPTAAPAAATKAPAAPAVTPPANDEGFVDIFDGKTLTGWDGDPKYWRVENGCMVGEITPETIVRRNTFIIWRGGTPKDFELKVEYRISDRGNSGVNYRSIELTDAKWSLAGYQADIDGQGRYNGQNYEERGRTFLARRGEAVRIDATSKPGVIASLGEPAALQSFVKTGDEWNTYHLIIRGNILTHILNGHVMSLVVDDDAAKRRFDGLIGVQVHVGPPMKVEYRSFRLKTL